MTNRISDEAAGWLRNAILIALSAGVALFVIKGARQTADGFWSGFYFEGTDTALYEAWAAKPLTHGIVAALIGVVVLGAALRFFLRDNFLAAVTALAVGVAVAGTVTAVAANETDARRNPGQRLAEVLKTFEAPAGWTRAEAASRRSGIPMVGQVWVSNADGAQLCDELLGATRAWADAVSSERISDSDLKLYDSQPACGIRSRGERFELHAFVTTRDDPFAFFYKRGDESVAIAVEVEARTA